MPGHEKVVERLEAAGLPYIAPEPVSLEDVYRDILDIGARIDATAGGEGPRIPLSIREWLGGARIPPASRRRWSR